MPLPASLHELHVLKSLSNSSLPRAVRTKGPKHTGPCCDLAIRRQRQEQQPPTTGTSRAACLPTNPVPVLKHCPLASPTAAPCAAALTACRGSQPAAEGLLSGQSGHKPPPQACNTGSRAPELGGWDVLQKEDHRPERAAFAGGSTTRLSWKSRWWCCRRGRWVRGEWLAADSHRERKPSALTSTRSCQLRPCAAGSQAAIATRMGYGPSVRAPSCCVLSTGLSPSA